MQLFGNTALICVNLCRYRGFAPIIALIYTNTGLFEGNYPVLEGPSAPNAPVITGVMPGAIGPYGPYIKGLAVVFP